MPPSSIADMKTSDLIGRPVERVNGWSMGNGQKIGGSEQEMGTGDGMED